MPILNEEKLIKKALDLVTQKFMTESKILFNPETVKNYLQLKLSQQEREIFSVIYLNNQNAVISYEELFSGTINRVDVHPRIIFQRALELNASSIILAHNHPSGNIEPSYSDRAITETIRQIGKFLDISILDHFIIGSSVISFAERGLL